MMADVEKVGLGAAEKVEVVVAHDERAPCASVMCS